MFTPRQQDTSDASTFNSPFFNKEDVPVVFLSKKILDADSKFVILPSFDFPMGSSGTQPTDPAWSTAWSAFMLDEIDIDDKTGKNLAFGYWSCAFASNRIGQDKKFHTFVSPETLRVIGFPREDSRPMHDECPVKDIRIELYTRHKTRFTEAEMIQLVKGDFKANIDAMLPSTKNQVAINVLMWDKNDPKPRHVILVLGKASFDTLKADLRSPIVMGSGDVAADPTNYPFLLHGDVTDPRKARVFGCAKRALEGMQNEGAGLVIGTETMEVTGDQLAQRVNFFDPQVWKIPTYQEILDYIVLDTDFPMDIIQDACSKKATVNERPVRSAQPQKSAAPSQAPGVPQTTSAPGVPAGAIPGMAPGMPAGAIPGMAPPAVENFYFATPTQQAELKSKEAVQELLDADPSLENTAMVVKEGGADWVKLSAAGFTPTAPVTPAGPPASPFGDTPSGPPASPFGGAAAPVEAATPAPDPVVTTPEPAAPAAAAGSLPREEVLSKMSRTDFGNLEGDDAAIDRLCELMYISENQDTLGNLTAEQSKECGEIFNRIS